MCATNATLRSSAPWRWEAVAAALRNSASSSKVFRSHYGRDLCRADSFEKSTSMNVVVMVSFVGGLAGRKESLWIVVCWRCGRNACVCARGVRIGQGLSGKANESFPNLSTEVGKRDTKREESVCCLKFCPTVGGFHLPKASSPPSLPPSTSRHRRRCYRNRCLYTG